jgi:hypothetical protein
VLDQKRMFDWLENPSASRYQKSARVVKSHRSCRIFVSSSNGNMHYILEEQRARRAILSEILRPDDITDQTFDR